MILPVARTWLLLSVLAISAPLPLAAQQPSEYEVKAAFLYNFTRFIDWPEEAFSSPDSPVVIGVLGEDPFDGALEAAIRGKKVGARPIHLRHARNVNELGNVHMLFVSRSESQILPRILRALRLRPVVTVSDIPEFTSSGGMIRFYMRGRRVAFEINTEATAEAGMRVSSRVLNVATLYRPADPQRL